jgi:hypothetical protein
MTARKRMLVTAAAAVGLFVAASSAGGQANGTPAVPTGFRVETLLMELSAFLPEEYARIRGAFGGPDGQPRQGQQGAQSGQGTQAGQQPGRFNLPQFKRDPKLMLTAVQVDALLPVLHDLQKTPFPTPSQAKKVTATVDATLTRQQKDAYDRYAKEREKAIAEMRKKYQSQTQGTQQGAPGAQPSQGPAQGGAGAQGQRQMDPAELRKRMLDAFITNLQEYRKGLR